MDVPGLTDADTISIHTPAKGVTPCRLSLQIVYIHFNPHPREGGDRPAVRRPVQRTDFNPHPREGGDDRLEGRDKIQLHFNPHPREGGDCAECGTRLVVMVISIHTPAKGVT